VVSLTHALLDALAVLAPVDCAGCGAPDRGLCADCRAAFIPQPTSRTVADGLVVTGAVRYDGVVRETVLAYKEQGRTDVAGALGGALAAVLRQLAQPGVELAPVPTSAAAWRRRGYDPVALLCREAGFRPSGVLRHSRTTQSQKTLGEHARASNLDHSLVARSSLRGRRFILVDDVVTSGATLVEARRAVVEAGGDVVAAVALAFTPRLFSKSREIS
jgi:ComF family protein